jgi:hypothetical protein
MHKYFLLQVQYHINIEALKKYLKGITEISIQKQETQFKARLFEPYI